MASFTASAEHWEDKVAKKQAAIKAGLPTGWKLSSKVLESQAPPISLFKADSQFRENGLLLTQEELDITRKYSAAELVRLMAAGILSSAQVTLAYCKRAAVGQQLTSCLTETFFAEAQERAEFLDRYLEREKKTIGPLHGLPISIKESFNVKGIPSTLGLVSYLDNPRATNNSPLVEMLLQAGAVLYVKTNIPQTMMTADSHNNVFGRVLNPYNTKLTAGGSTGGEGALIAFRGSPLGVGTDIAGSVRIPSLCCGLYGFKPSSGRIPYSGQASCSRAGVPTLEAVVGPLANTVADIELFLSTIIKAKPWIYDATAHAVHWRTLPDLPTFEPLVIGIQAEDPIFPLHPPIRRALDTAIAALKAAGHSLINLPPSTGATSVELANTIAWQYFGLDPSRTAIGHIDASGEPRVPSVQGTIELSQDHVKAVSLAEVPELNVSRNEYKKAWLKIFSSNNLDVIIGPSAQHTAVAHDTFCFAPYTSMWNVLDYPACVIPYSTASKLVDLPFKITPPSIGPDFDPIEHDGLPCSIQVIAPHFYDEELLRAVKVIDKVLNQ